MKEQNHDRTLALDHLSKPTKPTASAELPEKVGRYLVTKVIGRGAFGIVYQARDEKLDRLVAIKVPHPERVSLPAETKAYLDEAKTVANLDHPNIAPVHDVGATTEHPFFVVSKYISGADLYSRLKSQRYSPVDSVKLTSVIADALHYAHKKGLVHRDVKPSNILVDEDGRPYLVDFGLALSDEGYADRLRYAGTPAYMSPEQARGEGHRVDGRSDVFSLGIVLYELLAGKKPFRATTTLQLMEQIVQHEAKPLRQHDETISIHLERICQKAMAKKASDRYPTAHDFAEELRDFLDTPSEPLPSTSRLTTRTSKHNEADLRSPPDLSIRTGLSSFGAQTPTAPRIVPKGLRAFDSCDADFFLELLPGPRDRDGLPDSLRFWLSRIANKQHGETFSVGLLYGPSGCGKSSLVKAGVLPRLPRSIVPVLIDATAEDTEARLLRSLQSRVAGISTEASLREAIAALRRKQSDPDMDKVLIVIDQFEQWLHSRQELQASELVNALRQCDGVHVQCLILVRDDFWLAVSRFLNELEIPLTEGVNSALVDLFDVEHAKKVLSMFGRAYGRISEKPQALSAEEHTFINKAVAGLTESNKVICVRLSLFADMMRARAWTPSVLAEVGGADGLGITFLEEMFGYSHAPPEHRYHQAAVREVLKQLLPSSGTNIRGHMRSRSTLIEASGYQDRPNDFDAVIRILDQELRLITPADPSGSQRSEQVADPADVIPQHYQLTHDYMVSSIRDWLHRKKRETRCGRAEILLGERSSAWVSRKEPRNLPSFFEWCFINCFAPRRGWSADERRLMQHSRRYYGLRALALSLAVVACGAVTMTAWKQILASRASLVRQSVQIEEETRVKGLVRQLETASPGELAGVIDTLNTSPELADKFLAPLLEAKNETGFDKKSLLHSRLAAASRDSSLVGSLIDEMLTADVAYLSAMCGILSPFADNYSAELLKLIRSEAAAKQRLNAVAALASWGFGASDLSLASDEYDDICLAVLGLNPEVQPLMRDLLRPLRDSLLTHIENIFSDSSVPATVQLAAANAIADYIASDTVKLAELLTVATPGQFSILFPLLERGSNRDAVALLRIVVGSSPPDNLSTEAYLLHGKRRANAATALVRLGYYEDALSLFANSDGIESATQFAFSVQPRGVATEELLQLMSTAEDRLDGISLNLCRYTLLLACAEYPALSLPEDTRSAFLEAVGRWHRSDPSAAVHSASGWLLHRWGCSKIVDEVSRTPVTYSSNREWFTIAVSFKDEMAFDNASNQRLSAVDGISDETTDQLTYYYTFLVFPAGQFYIGSSEDEPGRTQQPRRETQHSVTLTTRYAILDREISLEEFIHFAPQFRQVGDQFGATGSEAAFGVSWYEAIAFCRWLGNHAGVSDEQQAYAEPSTLNPENFPYETSETFNWAVRDWPVNLQKPGFRLPTEAEWEVAVRSGSHTSYGFGSDTALLERFAWYKKNSNNQIHPAKQLCPIFSGLFDAHGNVLEWTHDWYADYDARPSFDPTGPTSGTLRTFHGGRWDGDASNCRTARRGASVPSVRSTANGFRICVSLPE